MDALLGQFVFLASDEDFEGWMKILLFVIIAAGYALSGILKAAKSRKFEKQEGQEEQGAQRRPARPVSRQRYRLTTQPKRPSTSQPKPVLQKAVGKKPKIKPQLEVRIKEPSVIKPVIEVPEFISESAKGLEDKQSRVSVPEEISKTTGSTVSPSNYFGEPLLDVSDPESLRRAILHYEILGKPLSLREPSEHVIRL